MTIHQELAERLWSAQIDGTPCEAPTSTHPEMTLQDAYEIQTINLSRRMTHQGMFGERSRHVGRKVGITSRAVQTWLGVTEPDYGGLLCDMAVPDGGRADITKLLQPRVEGEIAFVLKKPLFGPGVTAAQVVAAVDFVVPAIEIIDSRVRDWKFRIEDTVADNASSGMFVLGSRPMPLASLDLRTIGMTLRKNGEVVSTGAGAACLGNPVNAVVWLVNKLGEHGTSLAPGEVILSGALGPVSPVVAGDRISVVVGRAPEISVVF
ncbi:MAG TPA: fumarylacetoacetate hydrolase family protein [Candidatus Kapabacteria bacterium]|nr:fumarylacetoacetate hydrolase family protein [Candidatus Kapabacteria bacterium]